MERFLNWLLARPDSKRDHSRPTFREAYEAYQDACRRGDTRAQHDRWPALQAAMNDRLEAGV